jgi:hypothetical protein
MRSDGDDGRSGLIADHERVAQNRGSGVSSKSLKPIEGGFSE